MSKKYFKIEQKTLEDLLFEATSILTLFQQYDTSDFAYSEAEKVIQAYHDIAFYLRCYDDETTIIDLTHDVKCALNEAGLTR